MQLEFGRDICNDTAAAGAREWLVTNGIGGYASGTISGMLSRRYHGLLLAALNPPLGRTLLLAKLDETVEYGGGGANDHRVYPLYQNKWTSGHGEPNGHYHLNKFHLEGTTPVWTFACADALLEKRIWMELGANSTYLQYRLIRATGSLKFEAKALANYRDYHHTQGINAWQPKCVPIEGGLRCTMFEGAASLCLISDKANFEPHFEWYQGFYLSVEEYRGQDDVQEDHLHVAQVKAVLEPGESMTLVASSEAFPTWDIEEAYARRQAHEQALLEKGKRIWPAPHFSESVKRLLLAADQFVVKRPLAGRPDGHSIIAGYHWFTDWGRDTMISLPGLALATGRPEVAASILRTYAHFTDQGMVPNRFPDEGETPEYNTVDASLWFIEAIRAYYEATGDDALLVELFPVLEEIVESYQCGTRYKIHVDGRDGLVYAGEVAVQLTWMDAKVEDWVVTPRTGKPVEINALWYNALHIMAGFALQMGRDPDAFVALADKARTGFHRYWDEELGYCHDVLDGPEGDDASLRPNQLLAVALPHSPLSLDRQKHVVDICAHQLLTPHGLRSLAPQHPSYVGHYGGDRYQRDGAYHQGTIWSWLIAPFAIAHLRVYKDPVLSRSYLEPLIGQLASHGVGSISEIFDGDPPFTPRGCIAQAWSVAGLLNAWHTITMSDHPIQRDKEATSLA